MMRFLFWLVVAWWASGVLRRVIGWMLRGGSGREAVQNGRGGGEWGSPAEKASESAGAGAAAGVGATAENAQASRRLVRDPVCGVHVAEFMAIPLRENGELKHFCSTACRDQYLNETKKFAANG